MKLPLLSTLAALAREHVLALTVALLVAALAAGGFYGWRYYQYRQSSEYAFVRLQAALSPPKPEELALRVDFNTLSGHLAAAVRFNENIPGDYFVIGDKRYLVCDPTYIGANIGRTMQGMNNNEAQVILLDR